MAKITEKNTKAEIYEAYKNSLEKIQNIESNKFNPAKEIEEKKNNEIKKDAAMTVEMNILSEDVVNKYNNVTAAIELHKKELEDLYGIKKEANTFAALVDAKVSKLEEYEQQIKDADLAYINKTSELNEEYCTYKKKLQRDRDREEEEFNYNLKKQRKIENDKWEEEKAARIKKVEEREEEIAQREIAHENLLTEIQELHNELDEVPAMIQAAKDEAKAETKSKLETSYHFEKAAMEKDFEHMKEIYRSKIDTLEEKISDLVATNDELRENLNNSYDKVQTIASEAVKNSGVKVLDTNNK